MVEPNQFPALGTRAAANLHDPAEIDLEIPSPVNGQAQDMTHQRADKPVVSDGNDAARCIPFSQYNDDVNYINHRLDYFVRQMDGQFQCCAGRI